MPAVPDLTAFANAIKALLEGVAGRKYKVLNTEEVESFDNGENPDVLRSSLDPVDYPGSVDTIGRINAWIIRETAYKQKPVVLKTGYGEAPQVGVTITYSFELEFFYQFSSRAPGGLAIVRGIDKATRLLFSANPRLGLTDEQGAMFIDQRHSELQLFDAEDKDLKGAIAFYRAYNLTIPVHEPLA